MLFSFVVKETILLSFALMLDLAELLASGELITLSGNTFSGNPILAKGTIINFLGNQHRNNSLI